MGAWGIHTFECDGSLDWIGEFRDNPCGRKFEDVFTPAVPPKPKGFLSRLINGSAPAYFEPYDGEDVLGAAEVVAALLGRPSPHANGSLDDLPSVNIAQDIPSKAISAIDTILETSYLKDCWEETDDYEDWVAAVRELQKRLAQ
jgi:hypothetical protein